MKGRLVIGAALAALLLTGVTARADEGMWMVNLISKALEARMQEKGLQLSANEIYNAEAGGLTDAVVSMDFGCTGSIISDEGLVITNHHCAYSDVYKLSSDSHNYLEDGFWALKSTDEVPIEGKSIYLLRKVIDVTDEVSAVLAEAAAEGRPMGFRKIAYQLEKRYAADSGCEASLSSMWAGSKYYMALYTVFKDIRLVAAPPVSIAAFGGDVDNWEWPQQKCDFALYRIYTAPDGTPAEYSADNVPLKPVRKLAISTQGYADGDFAMVIGYPGRTDRYASAAKINYEETVSYPITNEVRAAQMKIVSDAMNADPAVRLKYSDYYFTLSNIQENNEGMVQCIKRFGVTAQRRAQDSELQKWILADGGREQKWGGVLEALDSVYAAIENADRSRIWYRETIVRGTRLAVVATRLNSSRRNLTNPRSVNIMKHSDAQTYSELDLDVEKQLFRYSVASYYANVDKRFWGEFQKSLFENYSGDCQALADALWASSWLTDEKRIAEFLTCDGPEMEKYCDDSLFNFLQEVKINDFNREIDCIQKENTPTGLGKEYTHALYEMRQDKGIEQYPDANSTMRLTYGTIGGYEPYDGVYCSSHSTADGILEKYDPQNYDYSLKPEWKSLLESQGRGMTVNFLTDNDITGGNSGSPVLNARGELIGLAFDGNKESLASDVDYTPQYNHCVNVDIRYVLWTLRNYARMDRILEEIGQL